MKIEYWLSEEVQKQGKKTKLDIEGKQEEGNRILVMGKGRKARKENETRCRREAS